MGRRRKTRDDERGSPDEARAAPRRSWAGRRLLGVAVGAVLLAGVLLVARSWFVARRTVEPGPRPQGEAASAGRQLAPFAADDPAFRPIEASSPELIEEAIADARRLADRYPDDPASIDGSARLQHHFGNSAEAVAAWERCLELDTGFVAAYQGIGSAALSREQFDRAAWCFRKVMELDPNSPRAPIDLAYALMGQGKLDDVVAVLEKATQAGLRSMPAFLLLGQAHQQRKEYEKAKTCFERAVQIAPEYPSAHYGLAMACARLGQREAARNHREQFRKLEAADREGRTRADAVRLEDQLSTRERLARAYADAGRNCARHGDEPEAEKLWRRAAALDGKNVACREALAALYEGSGREEESLHVCRELVQIDPNNGDYALNVGLLSARLGRFAAARSAVERAIELDPQNRRYREAYQLIRRGD